MENKADIPAELAAALRRYLAIQQEAQQREAEKADLRETISRFMMQHRMDYWYPEVDGQALKVRLHESTVIEYDEPVLRERLGPRYAMILAPDHRKIRRNIGQLAPVLSPVLDMVGSPAPEKVRAAIESGAVRAEEFAGAFKKTVKRIVAVMRQRTDNTPGGPLEETEA